MSKKNKNQISIPIIKNNKDLCRLIFQKAEAGKYDIKIECLGNSYQVYTYRLFSMSPICWNIENPQDVNMSYHHGAKDYPILIHLKDNSREGKERYRTLPATRILPPNVNQMFPIPLFRLEIPQHVVESAAEYKAKGYHHVLDAGTANVLEIYMHQNLLKWMNILQENMLRFCCLRLYCLWSILRRIRCFRIMQRIVILCQRMNR